MKNGDKYSDNNERVDATPKENRLKEGENNLFTSSDAGLSRKNSVKNSQPRADEKSVETATLPSQDQDLVIKKLKDLVGLMVDEGIAEIDIKEGDFSIYIKRRSARRSLPNGGQILSFISPDAVLLNGEKINGAPTSSSDGVDTDKQQQPEKDVFEGKRRITSPINGVFYKASSPKSPPFVSEGDVVEAGKTLCIIEAMKVMNEIKADARMKILKILVENGKTVTQGEPLFIVE